MLLETEKSPFWGLLFVLVGPPGAGKNTLMNNVLSRITDLQQLPTATTRPIRPTEQQGREHLFVDDREFQRMSDNHELLEQQIVHGRQYGIPRKTVEDSLAKEQDLIADIEVLGAKILRNTYGERAILVFIQPSSTDELRYRMQIRGEAEAEIEKRLRRVEMEMQFAPECDYLVINDSIERASEILYAIVLAERSRRDLLKLKKKEIAAESREIINEPG